MGRYKDPNTGNWVREKAMPIGDTLPIGSEVDYDGSVVPYGWEEVDEENAKIVYKKQMSTGQSDTYTFTNVGLYLLVAHTNGVNRCIMDVIMYVAGEIATSRIKDEPSPAYKSVTYSGTTVTMNNTNYTGMYSIIKIF